MCIYSDINRVYNNLWFYTEHTYIIFKVLHRDSAAAMTSETPFIKQQVWLHRMIRLGYAANAAFVIVIARVIYIHAGRATADNLLNDTGQSA